MECLGFKEAISKKLKDAAIYFGTSAGAAVACHDIDYMKDMEDPSLGDASDTKGLNLVDFLILPHADKNHPHFAELVATITEKHKNCHETLICLRDDHAVWLKDSLLQIA